MLELIETLTTPYFNPYVSNEDIEAQGGNMICSKPHRERKNY